MFFCGSETIVVPSIGRFVKGRKWFVIFWTCSFSSLHLVTLHRPRLEKVQKAIDYDESN